MNRLTAPRGTNDVLPPESAAWNRLEATARAVAERAGYGEIRTPMFESTELFVRGVGETTDIVEKEMYTFEDKGGRSMTLRPEWTASIVRALLEHKRAQTGPQRLYAIGPFFRYERPQAGRYRQAHQFDVESFGIEGPEADVEVIAIAAALLRAYRIDATLGINTIGDQHCRPAYREALLAYFRPLAASLSPDSQRRLERNPLRILDSKHDDDQAAIAGAPSIVAHLCAPCRAHFEGVRALLTGCGIAHVVNPRLVRGFDYYTRTVFEFSSSALGAQSAVCGGGRYDGLVESLGGPATPAVGFGLGLERFLMVVRALHGEDERPLGGYQAVGLGARGRALLVPIAVALRDAGETVYADWRERKIAAHFRSAEENGARFALIAGDDEADDGVVVVRDLRTRTQLRAAVGGTVTETIDAIRAEADILSAREMGDRATVEAAT